jgi:hypothetical protein
MAKLSFEMRPPEPPKSFLPKWLTVVLYLAIMSTCGVLIAATLAARAP